METQTHGIVGQIARIREEANALIEQQLRTRAMDGIVPAHGGLLAFLLGQIEPIPIKTLVAHVGRVKSTVTGMLNTLERHGYVRRFRSTEDQRVVFVALTERGRALREDFEAISGLLLARVYGSMPRKDREELVRLLSTVEQNLRASGTSR